MVRGTPGVFPSRGPTFRSSALVDFAASSESLPGFAGLRVSARLPSRGGRHVWDRSSGFAPPPALQRAHCSAVLPPPGTVPTVPQHPAFGFSPPGGLPVSRGCVLACGLVASRCWPWGSPRFRPPVPDAPSPPLGGVVLPALGRRPRDAGPFGAFPSPVAADLSPTLRCRTAVHHRPLYPLAVTARIQRLALPSLRLSPGFRTGPLLAFAGLRHRRMRPCPRPAA